MAHLSQVQSQDDSINAQLWLLRLLTTPKCINQKNFCQYLEIYLLKYDKNQLGRFKGVVSGVRKITTFLQPCQRRDHYSCWQEQGCGGCVCVCGGGREENARTRSVMCLMYLMQPLKTILIQRWCPPKTCNSFVEPSSVKVKYRKYHYVAIKF